LRAWIDFAWSLRGHDTTSRRLRELCILRTASLHHSQYEWHQHWRMAREVGVTDYQVAELEMWRTSDAFDAEERAALALTDAIIAGEVPDWTARCGWPATPGSAAAPPWPPGARPRTRCGRR
jgi:Carboxymuconolactone decarboxylase family